MPARKKKKLIKKISSQQVKRTTVKSSFSLLRLIGLSIATIAMFSVGYFTYTATNQSEAAASCERKRDNCYKDCLKFPQGTERKECRDECLAKYDNCVKGYLGGFEEEGDLCG